MNKYHPSVNVYGAVCATSLKQWIKTLDDEEETGIYHLALQEEDFIRCPCGQHIYLDLIETTIIVIILMKCYFVTESFASHFM